jgi:hypothetical protein
MFEQPKVPQPSYLRQEMRGEFIDAAGAAPAPAIAAGHTLLRRIRPQVDGFPVLQKEKIRAERASVAVDEKDALQRIILPRGTQFQCRHDVRCRAVVLPPIRVSHA